MKLAKWLPPILAWLLLAPLPVRSEAPPGQPGTAQAGGLQLSAPLAELLRREMNAIQEGMQALVPAIAAGEWELVARTGSHIQHSYILSQQLTDAQRHELHHALPPGFLELDQSFHRAAGQLAQAAREHNAEVAGFYYHRLLDACVACHGRYATRRFPGLEVDTHTLEHGH